MSTQTSLVCMKCKEILNSNDCIFGTSCGHLYHSRCLNGCFQSNGSEMCAYCKLYKPCMFKMYLEFIEPRPLSWEDQAKTIQLHSELEESKSAIAILQEKYNLSQVLVQQLESKLKKFDDTLCSRNHTISKLEEQLESLEKLNVFLAKEIELKSKNDDTEAERSVANYQTSNNANDDGNSSSSKLYERVTETKQNSEDEAIQVSSNNKENIDNCNTIIIRNYRADHAEKYDLSNSVLYMARKMGIALSPKNINNVFVLRKENNFVSLVVDFENISFKKQFLEKKGRLKNEKRTRSLQISELPESFFN